MFKVVTKRLRVSLAVANFDAKCIPDPPPPPRTVEKRLWCSGQHVLSHGAGLICRKNKGRSRS